MCVYVLVPGCVVDLVFVVDSSYLFSLSQWNLMLNFTASIASLLSIAPTGSQVGFVTYGFSATERFYLNRYTNTSQVVNAILSLPFNGDWSNQYAGLNEVNTVAFQPVNGNRTYAPDIVVFIAGIPRNQPLSGVSDPGIPALIAKNNGVKILSIGVNQANMSDIINIASAPKAQNLTYWYVPTFDQLYQYVGQVYNEICVPYTRYTAYQG